MDFCEYQKQAHSTSLNTMIEGNKFIYSLIGIGSEIGELNDKFKKLYRDKKGIITNEFLDDIKHELGDSLWYLQELATQLDLSLDDIAKENIKKLFSRKERNMIHGSGDNR